MLDIGVGDALYQPSDPNEPSLGFDGNEGYYWFLLPWFDGLAAETGQYIDLYGHAIFAGPDLTAVGRMLAEVRQAVAAQPESWQVHTGTQLRPAHQEIFKIVERAKFLQVLAVWEQAVKRARGAGRAVICFGD